MRRRLRNFFFPPPESSAMRRYSPLVLVVAVPVFILLALPPAWEYSNSSSFCGTTCHTMPPEYNTYLVSPHARVLCVDCHIGRDLLIKQFFRKSGHMRLLWATITGDYEYPIRVSKMRPARETCEQCHFPEKFSDDSLRVVHRYADDEENTPYDLYLLMHTGGGSQREGLGRGIHWHIENKIEYIALDAEEQNIPWVRVNKVDGTTEVYMSTDNPIDTANLGQYKLKEMDCITCHNRISHLIPTPRNVVDTALYQGDLPTDIPYIRDQAVALLSEGYQSDEEAEVAIADLNAYYQANYPDFYANHSDEVSQASDLLLELYNQNTYPDQELDWETHPDNIGHRDAPGCFRCHDGKHVNADDVAVRLECNLCHSIPQIVRPGEIEPMLPLTTGIEPESHLDSTWITRHHNEFDETCSNCHTTTNPGGTTDTSFCSNSGCHGVDWQYGGFDAPALAISLGLEQNAEEQQPLLQNVEGPVTYQDLQPVFQQQCSRCHGENPTRGLRVTEYATLMAGADDGPVIVPGLPDDSKIIRVLEAGHFAQLTDEQMALLRQWIADGAPEGEAVPATETPAPEGASGTEATPSEAGQESFWGSDGGEAATPTPAAEGGFWGGGEATGEPTQAPPATTEPAPTATEETEGFWGGPEATPTEAGSESFWGG